jgi:hypothetical protein
MNKREHTKAVRGDQRPPASLKQPQQYVVAEGADLTLKQARKRYPRVPADIIRWAVENIGDPDDLDRGLFRLEQAIELQLKYGE